MCMSQCEHKLSTSQAPHCVDQNKYTCLWEGESFRVGEKNSVYYTWTPLWCFRKVIRQYCCTNDNTNWQLPTLFRISQTLTNAHIQNVEMKLIFAHKCMQIQRNCWRTKLWASYTLLVSSLPVLNLENLSGWLLYSASVWEATCSPIVAQRRHAAKLNRPSCLTPSNRHTLERLRVSHVVKKFHIF